MKRVFVVLAVLVAAATAVFASGASAAGGSSDAAQACQHGGYLTLARSDGSSFKNAGDCVSYFAQGGSSAACTVTATTGCLIFDHVVMPELLGTTYSGDTVTITGAWSFNSTCNFADPATNACEPANLENNNYAIGAGTYAITNPTGAIIESGTLTTADTPGAHEGLNTSWYTAADGTTPTSCSAADQRHFAWFASTGRSSDPYVTLALNTFASDPARDYSLLAIPSDTLFQGPPAGVTVEC